jgi:hypothetical protein
MWARIRYAPLELAPPIRSRRTRRETLPFGNGAECFPHRAFAYSVFSVTADAIEQ